MSLWIYIHLEFFNSCHLLENYNVLYSIEKSNNWKLTHIFFYLIQEKRGKIKNILYYVY
jgi:hypothetical protein